MAADESDVGLSFRNAIHRLKRFKLKRLDFLAALQLGDLKAFIRLDSRHRFDIPALFWEKYDTAHLSFSPADPDFNLSLFDLIDAAMSDIERLRTMIAQGSQLELSEFSFLREWFEALIPSMDASLRDMGAATIATFFLSEFLRRGAEPCDVLVSQHSLISFEKSRAPKSKAGRNAVPGPDAMWEAVILLVAERNDIPKIDEIYRTMDDALPQKYREQRTKKGDLIYTVELLQTRAEQIHKSLAAVQRNS
jgi:hypothetical protein